MKTSLAFKFASLAKLAGMNFDYSNNPAVLDMQSQITALDGGVQFAISHYADGSWSAKSINIDGIITGGKNQVDVEETIKDAIFTYFNIEPQYCNDLLLRGIGERKTLKNEIYVTA